MRSMSSQTGRATHPILWTLAAVVVSLELRKLLGSACDREQLYRIAVGAMSHIFAVLILVRPFAPQLCVEGLAVERRQ